MIFTVIIGVIAALYIYRAVATEVVNHGILFKISKEARQIRARRWTFAIGLFLAWAYRMWG